MVHTSKYTIIDLSYLKGLSGGDKEFEKNVIRIFIKNTPLDLETFQDAIQLKHYHQIKITSHKLKSAVTAIGLIRLLELLETVENLSKEKAENPSRNHSTLTIIKEAYQEINDNCAKAIIELKNVLKEQYS